jgi:effector-binding domain-containing protein
MTGRSTNSQIQWSWNQPELRPPRYNRAVHDVQLKQLPEQPMAVVRGNATMANLPVRIGELFDQFYAGFKGKKGPNIVYYPGDVAGEFELACGVQLDQGGNASTPAGDVAATVHMGPYNQMKSAHVAIHEWVRANGRQIAGPSWEVYGDWSDDPAKLRTGIYYLLK